MSFYTFLFEVAIALMILGIFALPFLRPGTAEFYINIFGIGINALVSILSFIKLKKPLGR